MPAKASWLLHIPEIVEQLELFKVPVVDRAIIEMVFGLGRRQAIEFLRRFGGYQAGKTFLIERQVLIEGLRRLMDGDEFRNEILRKERLNSSIDQLHRNQAGARVKIPVPAEALNVKMAGLSRGIVLGPGHLHIQFVSTEDLLCKLVELSQAAPMTSIASGPRPKPPSGIVTAWNRGISQGSRRSR
jgi:hypothetical protein